MGGVWQTSVLRSINCKTSLSGHFNSMKLTNAPGYPVIHTRNQSVTTKIDVHQASACIRLIACTKFSAKLVVMTKTLWLTPYLVIPAPSFLQLLQESWGLESPFYPVYKAHPIYSNMNNTSLPKQGMRQHATSPLTSRDTATQKFLLVRSI